MRFRPGLMCTGWLPRCKPAPLGALGAFGEALGQAGHMGVQRPQVWQDVAGGLSQPHDQASQAESPGSWLRVEQPGLCSLSLQGLEGICGGHLQHGKCGAHLNGVAQRCARSVHLQRADAARAGVRDPKC